MNDLFFYNKRAIAATHSFKLTVFSQNKNCSKEIIITVTNHNTSLISSMYILKEVCYLTASVAVIHFFYGSVMISREHLKRSICQGHCVYFTTLVATIHYYKRSVVDLRKFEGYVYLRKAIVALLF